MYTDIQNDPELHAWFDTSNYPTDHPLYSAANKMVIGKMKDEAAGKIMVEVVGLRAKMYSFQIYDPASGRMKETKKAKGIQKAAMQTVSHEMYLHQLRNAEENRVSVRRIGQVMHTVFTFENQKRALCAFDDKRYLLEDRIDTLAHGHYRIRDNQTADDGDGAPPAPLSDNGVSALVDDDGDEHIVATQRAVVERPVLQNIFANADDDDDDDDDSDSNSNNADNGQYTHANTTSSSTTTLQTCAQQQPQTQPQPQAQSQPRLQALALPQAQSQRQQQAQPQPRAQPQPQTQPQQQQLAPISSEELAAAKQAVSIAV